MSIHKLFIKQNYTITSCFLFFLFLFFLYNLCRIQKFKGGNSPQRFFLWLTVLAFLSGYVDCLFCRFLHKITKNVKCSILMIVFFKFPSFHDAEALKQDHCAVSEEYVWVICKMSGSQKDLQRLGTFK